MIERLQVDDSKALDIHSLEGTVEDAVNYMRRACSDVKGRYPSATDFTIRLCPGYDWVDIALDYRREETDKELKKILGQIIKPISKEEKELYKSEKEKRKELKKKEKENKLDSIAE